MNAAVQIAQTRRHRFTVEEACALGESGALGDTRVEVIDGELLDMPSDGPLHRDWTCALNAWLVGAVMGRGCMVMPNTTLELSPIDGPSPDFYVFPAAIGAAQVCGSNVLLVIEQADTSLAYDLGGKALLYAAFGVRDYWVIDLKTRRLYAHRDPRPQGYAAVHVVEACEPIEALLVPGLSLRMADLPRVGG